MLSGDLKIFIDRLNPLYARNELNAKKMISLSIDFKDNSLYSTETSLTSLNSFTDVTNMKIILKHQFYNCLKSNDILSHENEINKFIKEVKEKIKS